MFFTIMTSVILSFIAIGVGTAINVRGPSTLIPDDFDFGYMELQFVVVAFPQSGTTTMVNWLRQHPSIGMLLDSDEDNVFWVARM